MREKRELKRNIEKLTSRIMALQEILDNKQDNYDNLCELIKSLEFQRDTLLKEIKELEENKNQLFAELSFGKDCKSMKDEYEKLRTNLLELKEYQDISSKIKELTTKYNNLLEIVSLNEEKDKLLDSISKLKEQETSLKVKLDNMYKIDDLRICSFKFNKEKNFDNVGVFCYLKRNNSGYEIYKAIGVMDSYGILLDEMGHYASGGDDLMYYIKDILSVDSAVNRLLSYGLDSKGYSTKKSLSYDELLDILKLVIENKEIFKPRFTDIDTEKGMKKIKNMKNLSNVK